MAAQRSHKSAKFHGGTRTALPQPVWALIDRLCQLTVFDLERGTDKYCESACAHHTHP